VPTTLDDLRWLASTEGDKWLDRLADETDVSPNLVSTLRKELSAERTHALLEQVDLRRRARDKFEHADQMLFTRQGLEQATDEWIASFKAARFPAGADLHDLCCGIGGDSVAMAQRGECVAVDRDPMITFLAAHNVAACGAEKLSAECADVSEWLDEPGIEREALWHIDPDRRADGRRHSRVEAYLPGIDVLERLTGCGRGGAIKLAPAAELPEPLAGGAALEWISRGGECKQLVAWYGYLAAADGQSAASALDRSGALVDRFSAQPVVGQAAPAAEIGRYVYDPDAALLAANLVEALAEREQLSLIDPHSRYLTGDHLTSRSLVPAFEVIEVLPLDIRRLRQALAAHNVGRVEWKKRAAPVDLVQLAGKCKLKGDLPGVVIVTPWQGRTMAIVCRRVS